MAHFYLNGIKCVATQPERIKVLYTIPNFDTAGSGKALLNIATRLDKDKFEPHIMCMHDRGEFFNVVKASGIPVHILEYTTPMKPYLKGLWQCWKISRALKKINPDLIHSFHYSADYSEPLAAQLAGIRWIYTKKNMMWGGSSSNAWKVRTLLAAAIITINTEMKLLFFSKRNNVFNISRGIDTEYFSTYKRSESIVMPHIFQEKRMLVCVANLVPVKGIEILIDAFKLIHRSFPDWALCIVGNDENEYGKSLKVRISSYGLSDVILFAGKQEDIRNYLVSSEILILPTLEKGEGFGVVLIEAMASGLPVLGSDVAGIRDQLHAFSDFMIRPGDPDDLRQKLSRLMSRSKEELRDIGLQFKKHCYIFFDVKTEVRKHEEVYKKVLRIF